MSERNWSLLACVGWGLSWIAVAQVLLVQVTTCTQGDTDSWGTSLVIGLPLTAAAVAFLLPPRTHARATRWLAVPHAVLLPAAAVLVARYFSLSTVHGMPLCDIATGNPGFAMYGQDWWNRWWAPMQLLVIGTVAATIYRYWHGPRTVDDRLD